MEHVKNLLEKNNITFKISGKDYIIRCLNPDHPDRNPSLRVDSIKGDMHCFSCGFRTNIFKYFGLTGNFITVKQARLKDKLKSISVQFNGVTFPIEDVIPYTKSFRGISAKTLQEFEAFYVNTATEENLQDRIFFPIKDIRNKVQCFLGRHLYSNEGLRYFIYPKHVQMPLLPSHLKEPSNSIILVEGIFDYLKLYDYGITNVVCAFGTNTLEKDIELKLLPFKAQGVHKIFLLFDGDKAGRDAMLKLEPKLQQIGFATEIIHLPDGMDPGELDEEYLNSIKEYISGQKSSDN